MPTMTRPKKLTFAAGAAGVALLVAGLGAAGAIAASGIFSPNEESTAVIEDAASQLGFRRRHPERVECVQRLAGGIGIARKIRGLRPPAIGTLFGRELALPLVAGRRVPASPL